MRTFSIDKNNPIPELELSLHRPNEQQIGSLSDAYDRNGTFSFGRYNELEITVPKYVVRQHKQVPYHDFEEIRDKYLVKATYGGIFSEFLVVTKIHKSKNGMPTKRITLRSRQYELNNKILRNLEALSYTPEEIITLALDGTNWRLGTIDPEFNKPNDEGLRPRRSFDETKITTLNLLYKIAETFGGILQFDTFNRTVSMYKPENAEIDKGFTASYGKYIKSLDEDIDAESVVTRLYIYGENNLTINEVNPTGQSYLEDFSYYMQGYETDEDGNVISSSKYMSDELCQAIIDYNLLIIEKEGYFKNFLDALKPIQDEWVERLSEFYSLEAELEIIEDNLDIAKAQNENTTSLKQQLENKKAEISAKQSEIDELELQMQMIENDIQELREELSLENNFTPDQIKERNDYISYGEWSDENYFDVNELYEKAKEVMKKMRAPQRDLDVSLIQFLNTVESKHDWDKIGLGYVIHTDYEPLDIEFKALITEMQIGFDNNDLSITISNVDYKNDKLAFLEMLYGTAVSTADRVQEKGKEWSDNIDRTDYLAEFLENPWDTARQRIIAGADETVDISRRGIIIRNPRFPNERLQATAGVLALSLDDGETWSTAISPYGVAAEVIIGKIILGEKLEIGDEEGTFTINGNLLTIKDRNEIVRLRLGEYASNRFGLQLMNKSGNQVVLDENGILQTWQVNNSDNVDTSHGLTLYLYLPTNTLDIRDARLNFRLLPFRSYSATTQSGGGSVQTSGGGGGTNTTTAAGGATSRTTESGGGSAQTSAAGGDHYHLMFKYADEIPASGITLQQYRARAWAGGEVVANIIAPGADVTTYGSSGNHTHGVQIPSHSHGFNVPNHTHNLTLPNHTHQVTIPAHTHDIAHGIYTSTIATGVGVIINGINRTTQLGGKFNSSQANVNIKDYLVAGRWNEIELTSDRLGRIDANIYLEIFTAT